MKKHNILIAVVLILTMLLSACATAVETEQPMPTDSTTEPYPIDDSQEPDQEPDNPYPVEETPEQEDSSDVSGGQDYITDPIASQDDLEDQAEEINKLAVALYQKLAAEEGNLIYSPYSIYQAFLMVYAGAAADTKTEIAQALNIDLDDDQDVHNLMNALNKLMTSAPSYLAENAQPLQFNVANALWVQQDTSFEQDFLDTLSANYNAGLKLVDFSDPEAARQAINLWVASQTNDKIKDLIPEGVLNELTRLVITNAVYFKGAWQNPFDLNSTKSEPFYLLDGSEQSVEMMHNSFTGSGLVSDRFQAVKLNYQGGNYAMAVIMPTGDFAEFEQTLDEDTIKQIMTNFDGNFGQVNLGLPKFKNESSFNLGEQLKALGIQQAFDSQAADFSGISETMDLYITDVLHKAYIDVNEEGTEAAAATAIAIGTTSMPTDSWDITFDHPFIYVIYETTTNTIVFMGRVVAP